MRKRVILKKKHSRITIAKTCATGTKPLGTVERKRLPDSAFGLPRLRKYPLYRYHGGKLIPDGRHAANAKARAAQQLKKGNLTPKEYAQVVARADKVLRQCSGRGGMRSARSKLREAARRDA